jgi:7tm Chemosensory receptor
MPSPENYYPIWKVFLLFAVYPLPNTYVVTASGKAHLFWFLWRGLMLAVSCLLIAYSYWQRENIFYYADVAGQVNDILQYISLSMTGLVVIVENFRKQECHIRIWKMVARIQKLCQLAHFDQQLNKKFAIKFWVCFSIYVVAVLRVLTQVLAINDDQWLRLWCVMILPLTMCNLMFLVHIYYFTLLGSYFEYVQQELKEIVTFAKYSMYVKLDRSVITRRLEAVKDMHGMLFQVSENINAIFIWSQAFNFIRLFLQCTCDLHWFFKEFEQNFPILIFNFFPRTVILLLLLHDANLCEERARSLAPLLFQIKFIDGEMALHKMVRICHRLKRIVIQDPHFFKILQFSAQLSHAPISFGGRDLYTINYGLLRTLIAGIITYMIIFIQMLS